MYHIRFFTIFVLHLLHKATEPSKYCVAIMDHITGLVQSFQEIPQKFVGNRVNAGVYLMNPSVLNRIELTPTSMETKVFLNTVADRKLYAMFLPHEGFWMEIGGQRD
ncbi:hypothetical protein JHK86_032163 [Glycine max]|nr:hypothetical protein JHK86_032163 [Glycine max]